MKRIIISVTNDLITDQRVHKIASTLSENHYQTLVVGRKLKHSQTIKRHYATHRFRMLFKKGFAFYAAYNIRLFFFLLFRRFDMLLANDLDTLAANFLVSKIRRKPLIYDSHELFTQVPELIHRKKVQHFWQFLESNMMPRIKYLYTVCDSIACRYNQKYAVDVKVIRNVPYCHRKSSAIPDIPFPTDKKIVLYQGAVNIGRGLDYVIRAMTYINNVYFVVIGDGDVKNELVKLSRDLNVAGKVIFTGRIPFHQLAYLTKYAHIGISLEENLGLNYYYALPNKLFDYIRAHVPVLASPLPEIRNIVEKHTIGLTIEQHDAKHIAEKIDFMLTNENARREWKNNLKKIAPLFCWEKEKEKLLAIFREAGSDTSHK